MRAAGVGSRDSAEDGSPEYSRRRDRAWASARRDGRRVDDEARQYSGADRRTLRAPVDVHRIRNGDGDDYRASKLKVMATSALLTAEQYLATHLSDEYPPEFVRGELVYRSMPKWLHSRLQHLLSVRL